MKKNEMYTELALQIDVLDQKLNKILELLNKPEVELKHLQIKKIEDVLRECPLQFEDVVPVGSSVDANTVCGVGKITIECTPTYGTAQPLDTFTRNKDAFAETLGSEDEQFLENYK